MADYQHSPAAEGFYMPPEWVSHEGCFMAWPKAGDRWGEVLDHARITCSAIARHIAATEPVTVIADPNDDREAAFACGSGVEVEAIEIDDCWIRDTGPIFVTDGQGTVAGVDWQFNGWGNPDHGPHSNDAALAATMLQARRGKSFQAPMVLEGGSVHVDEFGTLLTTEQCLLNRNRNPTLSRQQLEERLAFNLGIRKIVWLGEGFDGDPAGGHVNNIACFADGGRVLVNAPQQKSDPNYEIAADNAYRLSQQRNAAGQAFEVIDVPQPEARFLSSGERLMLSYVNFYFANEAVILPAFDDPLDDDVARLFGQLFSDKDIIQINVLPILYGGGGGIHSMTLPLPAAP